MTLDKLIREQHLQQPDVMKIDIEGGELFTLTGARKTITTAHLLLLLEFNPRMYQAAGYKPTDILVELEAYDYQNYALSQDARAFTIYPQAVSLAKSLPCLVHSHQR